MGGKPGRRDSKLDWILSFLFFSFYRKDSDLHSCRLRT